MLLAGGSAGSVLIPVSQSVIGTQGWRSDEVVTKLPGQVPGAGPADSAAWTAGLAAIRPR